MSHSGVPGVEEIAQMTAGNPPPAPTAPPTAPSVGTNTQAAEEDEEKNAGQGQAADILTGGQGVSNQQSARQVLLGS